MKVREFVPDEKVIFMDLTDSEYIRIIFAKDPDSISSSTSYALKKTYYIKDNFDDTEAKLIYKVKQYWSNSIRDIVDKMRSTLFGDIDLGNVIVLKNNFDFSRIEKFFEKEELTEKEVLELISIIKEN